MLIVLDILRNAEYNLKHNAALFAGMASKQLSNAIKLIDQGKGLYDEVSEEEIENLREAEFKLDG